MGKVWKQLSNGQQVNLDESIPLLYIFNEGVVAPPASGNVIIDNADYSIANNIFINDAEDSVVDVSSIFSTLKIGSIVSIRAINDTSKFVLFSINGTVVDNTTYFTLPISFEADGGFNFSSGDDLSISFYVGDGEAIPSTSQNPFVFDSVTVEADPTAGKLRFNNAADASTTEIYIDILNDDGLDITAKLERIGIGSVIQIQEKDDPTNSAIFDVSAEVTDETGFFKIPVTFKASGTGADLTDATDIIVFIHTSTEKFIDSLFRIRDDADKTKQLAYDVNGVTTATTVTQTVPDYNGEQVIASTPGTKTPAGTTETIDWKDGLSQILDLDTASGDVTLTLNNPVAGQSYLLKIIQGATARDVILPSTVLFPGATAPTTLDISITDNAIDTLTLYFDGTNYLGGFGENYG